MQEQDISPALFVGQWIGETQGCDMPAHLWEITHQALYLFIVTRWEGETRRAHFHAQMVPGEPAFQMPGVDYGKAILIDRQHFVIPGWSWEVKDSPWDETSPRYDVMFSRPGIAELTARTAYLRYLENNPAGGT